MSQKEEISFKQENLKHLYNLLPFSVFAYLLASFLISVFLWNEQSSKNLTLWLSITIIISIIRFFTIDLYKSSRKSDYRLYYRLFFIELIISTLPWGFAGFFIFSANYAENILIIATLLGLALGGVTSLSSNRKMLNSFLILLITPNLIRLFTLGTEEYQITGYLLMIFLVLIIIVGGRIHNIIIENLHFKERHKKAIEELTLSENRFRSIFEHAPVGIFYYDNNLLINEFNEELTQILDAPGEQIHNFNLKLINNDKVFQAVTAALSEGTGVYEGEYISIISGRKIWINLVCSPLFDDEKNISGAVAIVQDRTEMRLIEEQVRHLAYHDGLTGLPNRLLLKDRIGQALSASERHKHFGAILFLDLDNFKTINDTLGHHIGDLILKETAERIGNILRIEDTVARIGGDEFVIILPRLHMESENTIIAASLVSDKIHKVLSEPYNHMDNTLYTSTSIGITLFSGKTEDIDILLKNADTAMYEAKKSGRSCTHFFKEEMNLSIKKRLTIENYLRNAIDNKELIPYFQPIYDIKQKRIIGAETLLRWNHPLLGMVSPVDFIPLAEETNLIIPIGEWLMEEVCRFIAKWNRDFFHPLNYISLNISVKQLQQMNFTDKVVQIMGKYNIPPKSLVFEITENVLIGDFNTIAETVSDLRKKGIPFALDDFGTGYSSLTYLKKLELDIIKIDRSFIIDIIKDQNDSTLVEAILTIAENFEMKVVAEGVEDIEQIDHMTRMGCRFFQGYYYSRPMPAHEFEKLISS